MILVKVQTRLEELIALAEQIKATKERDRPVAGVIAPLYTWVDSDKAQQWTMSATTILKSALGEGSDNYKKFARLSGDCCIYENFCHMQAILKATLEDLKGGYFFESKALLEAEVFGGLLEQAEELQKAGYKDAAAVIIGGVLEQHLRSMCARRSIGLLKTSGKHKMINDLNDDLAKDGAYNLLKKKQITAWADMRNNAAHGNYSAYNSNDVDAFIRDVTGFCADYT